jgi:hypothetical protein
MYMGRGLKAGHVPRIWKWSHGCGRVYAHIDGRVYAHIDGRVYAHIDGRVYAHIDGVYVYAHIDGMYSLVCRRCAYAVDVLMPSMCLSLTRSLTRSLTLSLPSPRPFPSLSSQVLAVGTHHAGRRRLRSIGEGT